MDRWITYVQERFPLPTMGILIAGISLSGIFLQSQAFAFVPFLLSFLGVFFFFMLLRLMDEVKDLEKDRIAHPERPLPRGLIKKEEAVKVIDLLQISLFAYSLFLWVCLQQVSALAYLVVVIYLWMMYKEFGIGKWLSAHPITYAISHQLVAFPLAIFVVSVANPEAVLAAKTLSFGLMLLGAFFCYEICRKLDPQAHPVLATYMHFYGFRKTFEFAVFTLALAGMGAIALGLGSFLVPCEIVVLLTLCLLFFHSSWYRIPEVAASISLLIHVWGIVIKRFML